MRKFIRVAYRILVGISLVIIVLRLVNWEVKRSHHLPALPAPNGYDEIVAAAGDVKSPVAGLAELSTNQIRELADGNRPALERARKAFQTESRVVVQPTQQWNDHHDDILTSLRRLAVAFGIESVVTMQDQHTNEAAQCDLDMLHLADCTGRGGIITDGIESMTIEALAMGDLQPKVARLDKEFCRKAAAEIESLLANRETPETTFAMEKNWSAKRYGLVDLVGGMVLKQADASRHAKFIAHYKDAVRREQHLMLRLASRAYVLDNQRNPENASSLVPQYLKSVPVDPETKQEIQELPLAVQ